MSEGTSESFLKEGISSRFTIFIRPKYKHSTSTNLKTQRHSEGKGVMILQWPVIHEIEQKSP